MTGWLDLPKEIRQYIYHLKDLSDWKDKIKKVNSDILEIKGFVCVDIYAVYDTPILTGKDKNSHFYDFYIECFKCGFRSPSEKQYKFIERYLFERLDYLNVCGHCKNYSSADS